MNEYNRNEPEWNAETSDEYKLKKVQESIDSLSKYCDKTEKLLIGV